MAHRVSQLGERKISVVSPELELPNYEFNRWEQEKMKKIIPILILIFALPASAHAKAYLAPKAEMIAKSDVIAVVNITDVKSLEPEKMYGNQRAKATVRDVLKGDVKREMEIEFMVKCFYPCAITQVSKGEYLVFLSKKDNDFEGNNWHLSYRPIKDGAIEWYKDDTGYELKKRKLGGVLDEIRGILKTSQPPAPSDAVGPRP
jgi:hypothetical protein